MSDHSSFGSGGGDKKQEVMDQVRSELALANAQELINCVPKPGYRLESGEQTCLSKCMDRYMEAWNIVSRTYVSRLQQESRSGGLGSGLGGLGGGLGGGM
ncbi:hypothetical protein BC937DRAFT_89847 [Endogone sp. FLAS-F59071]|nr:hypothetical protein BC937DRAFT_89847 [Endogone sp. FLAS-F59071]|eukprot:RUS22272.1 hypothetical protein BC937DRAFT_89847 [Endogone sp. FLAS-F59071]